MEEEQYTKWDGVRLFFLIAFLISLVIIGFNEITDTTPPTSDYVPGEYHTLTFAEPTDTIPSQDTVLIMEFDSCLVHYKMFRIRIVTHPQVEGIVIHAIFDSVYMSNLNKTKYDNNNSK